MTRLRAAARRLASGLRKYAADLHVYAGVGALAWGVGQTPEPLGAIFGPAVVGLGLIWIVRFGASPRARS